MTYKLERSVVNSISIPQDIFYQHTSSDQCTLLGKLSFNIELAIRNHGPKRRRLRRRSALHTWTHSTLEEKNTTNSNTGGKLYTRASNESEQA
jgi:hypothetical protein